jgi:hypothetical protein
VAPGRVTGIDAEDSQFSKAREQGEREDLNIESHNRHGMAVDGDFRPDALAGMPRGTYCLENRLAEVKLAAVQ